MHVAHQPAVIYVAHDMFDRIERQRAVCGIMHGEEQAGEDLANQHNAGDRAKIPEIVQVAWSRVFNQCRV